MLGNNIIYLENESGTYGYNRVHAEENKRRTLQRSDIATAISKTDMCDFLIDIVPREEAVKSNAVYDHQTAYASNTAAAAAAATTNYYPQQYAVDTASYYPQLPQVNQSVSHSSIDHS